MSESKEFRIHIGNISDKLHQNPSLLNTRIEKFGKIIQPLEFHTKPVQLHYFAYITISTTQEEFEKLKKSLNGITFMGMKLSINLAKPSYLQKLEKQNQRHSKKKEEEQLRRDKIVRSRLEKIQEYKTTYPINNITSTIVTSINPSSYSISEHTYNNISGNTKFPIPKKRLIGNESYGNFTNPKKIQRCKFTLRSGKGVIIKGTHRKSPRLKLGIRQQTLRILINGELKTFKGYKTKLWGIEKNKTVRELTWNYVDGEWRSGDDHVIERYSTGCGISGAQARNYGKDIAPVDDKTYGDQDAETEQQGVNISEGSGESEKNKSILASMFSTFDFDKPIGVDDDDDEDDDEIEVDSKGRKKLKHYDYEIEGKVGDSDDDDDDDEDMNNDKIDIDSANKIIHDYTQLQIKEQKPIKEQYYDEDDEGNDIEMDEFTQQFTTEAIKDKYDEEHEQEEEDHKGEEVQEGDHEEEDEEEEEFIPTFGSAKPITNDTETLRSLFNPTSETTTATTSNTTTATTATEAASTFKLGLSDDDEDLDKSKQIDTIKQEELFKQLQTQKQDEIILQNSKKFGLFWSHFESPFLSTQSQLSKLGNDKIKLPGENPSEGNGDTDGNDGNDNADESLYEKWFWNMRGEISRECKRRKRDVLRSLRKKKKGPY